LGPHDGFASHRMPEWAYVTWTLGEKGCLSFIVRQLLSVHPNWRGVERKNLRQKSFE
jgi:hypothetical protein